MKSKLTREQLRERAQLKAKNLASAISQSAFASCRSELEEELQFLQCALACMEDEPVEPIWGAKKYPVCRPVPGAKLIVWDETGKFVGYGSSVDTRESGVAIQISVGHRLDSNHDLRWQYALQPVPAMDSEPHPDDELSNLLWYSQEATCHSDPNYYCEFQRLATPGFIAGMILELQERRKAAMDSEPYGFTDGDRRGMIYEPQYADRLNNPIPVYRHAQPGPVVDNEPVAESVTCWSCRNEVEISAIGDCDGYCPKCDAPIVLDEEPYTSPQPAPDREQVRSEHAEWSQATFGNVGPIGPLKHLRREVLEAIAKPHDLIEWADMQFLLWDAQRRAGITDEQITQAMIEKLAVNKQREWPEPKDGEPRLHIKGQPVRDGFPPDEIECDICGHVSTDPEGRHHCCEDNSND